MPHIVFVATDVFGQKLNYELEFPTQPSVMELLNHIENVFTAEQNVRKVGMTPYKVSKLNVVDETTEDWVEVVAQSQLKNYCQVYAFQPHSTQATESQGHIPTAIRPRHLQVTAGMGAVTPIMASAGSRGPSVGSYAPAAPVIHGRIQSTTPTQLPPVIVPHASMGGLAQVKLLPADASHDEKVRAAFEGLDANANQLIESEELKRGFQMFGIDFSNATTDDLFRKADMDRDGVINYAEWQRFCELYPTLLDSLYYRLKSHWEITAATMELEQFAGHRASLEEAERNVKNDYDRSQLEADEAERRLLELERAASDTSAKQRAAEEHARESVCDTYYVILV